MTILSQLKSLLRIRLSTLYVFNHMNLKFDLNSIKIKFIWDEEFKLFFY